MEGGKYIQKPPKNKIAVLNPKPQHKKLFTPGQQATNHQEALTKTAQPIRHNHPQLTNYNINSTSSREERKKKKHLHRKQEPLPQHTKHIFFYIL
ncbi:hypothetical protein GDO78_019002 [Eleutherodactylus coqui]|uniref:Uncharacterized protein n=1 Tax=Eleutherodactylus coqui TaxID=57060 RepID=A0A8J6EJK3_ELECQ|nr:hypothetical protein GDO78_019002 [Eleutherodactylus coqui]